MGITVGLLGDTGVGKTTSIIVNKDGSFDEDNIFNKEYTGMSPKTFFYINLDKKRLPFPGGYWKEANGNYAEISDMDEIRTTLMSIAKAPNIRVVALDTLNLFLAYKEFNGRKKMTFDQWRDVTNDIVEIISLCNSILRDDQIAYIMGHTEEEELPNGGTKTVFSAIGKKQKKQKPESFFPLTIMTKLEDDGDGDTSYFFEVHANRSTAKTPLGMFKKDEMRIPKSLSLLTERIQAYYGILDIKPKDIVIPTDAELTKKALQSQQSAVKL